jgi:hypothetical protein
MLHTFVVGTLAGSLIGVLVGTCCGEFIGGTLGAEVIAFVGAATMGLFIGAFATGIGPVGTGIRSGACTGNFCGADG